MKKILLLIIMAALVIVSCSDKEKSALPYAGEPVVFGVDDGISRAAINYDMDDYFTAAAGFDKVTVMYSGNGHAYSYAEGLLSAAAPEEAVIYPYDGSRLSGCDIYWPADDVRSSQGNVTLKDQSTKENFLAADWLKVSLINISPTKILPVTFSHERGKIMFSLTGTYEGKDILSLEIGGFKAYCGEETNDAQLMYDLTGDKGSLAPGTSGTVRIRDVNDPISFMLIDSPDNLMEEAGDHCTIKLNL